jgi:hypothetical protein
MVGALQDPATIAVLTTLQSSFQHCLGFKDPLDRDNGDPSGPTNMVRLPPIITDVGCILRVFSAQLQAAERGRLPVFGTTAERLIKIFAPRDCTSNGRESVHSHRSEK